MEAEQLSQHDNGASQQQEVQEQHRLPSAVVEGAVPVGYHCHHVLRVIKAAQTGWEIEAQVMLVSHVVLCSCRINRLPAGNQVQAPAQLDSQHGQGRGHQYEEGAVVGGTDAVVKPFACDEARGKSVADSEWAIQMNTAVHVFVGGVGKSGELTVMIEGLDAAVASTAVLAGGTHRCLHIVCTAMT